MMLYHIFEWHIIFFFKPKTAYEMRISDWSSDVCSSDLVITAVDQEKFLQAGVGNPDFYRVCESYFPCGSPLENDAGLDMIRPGGVERAKKMLADAGYDGTKVVLMQPTDRKSTRLTPVTNAHLVCRLLLEKKKN